jgi:hypothetical protein
MSTIDFQLALVKTAEQNRPRVNGPDTNIDFFEVDVLFHEDLVYIDPAGSPTDAAIAANTANF